MNKITLIIAVVFGVALTSCNNKALEERIGKLEGRIAVLEAQAASQKSPIAQQQADEPVKQPETKPEGPLPAFKFTEETFDFGKIQEGDVVKHTFEFTNTGDAPLVISQASATCGCTVPDWPKEPIAPGKKGKIKVQFNSKGKNGSQNKVITLTANTWPTTNQISITADVDKKK